MKRKDENKIVIRTSLNVSICCGICIILFLISMFIILISEEEILSVLQYVLSVVFISFLTVYVVKNFMKKEILFKERLNDGILIIQNECGKVFNFKLEKIRYKIFYRQEKVLIYDDKSIVLLQKSKKLLLSLKEVGALKKEL